MKQFSKVQDLFDYCEEINFLSIQVIDDQGKVLVNGTNAKNSWSNNKQEVERFLEQAEKSYLLKIRKSTKGASQELTFIPAGPGKESLTEKNESGKVALSEYTKCVREKFEAISRAQIAEAENVVLKEQLSRFNTGVSDQDQDEEEEAETVVETLADRAMNIYQANSQSIQPIFAALAEKAVSFLSGGNQAQDDATATTFQMLSEKLKGKQFTEMENNILQSNFAKLGARTQQIVAQLFN